MQRYERNSAHDLSPVSKLHHLRHRKGFNAVRAPQSSPGEDSWAPLSRPLLGSTFMAEDLLEESMHPNMQAVEMLDATIKYLKDNHMNTQALSCSEQLLSLKLEMYGFAHPNVLQTLEEVVRTYNSVALELLSASKYTECLNTLHKAEALIKPETFYGGEACQVLTYNNIACCLRRMGKLKSSLRYLKEALRIGLNCQQVKNISVTYMNLCAVSSQLEQHDAALEYAQAAVFYVQDELVGIESVDVYASTGILEIGAKEQKLLALAIAYHNFAVELEFNNRGEASLQWYKKALQIGTRCKEINPALYESFVSTFEDAKRRYERVVKAPRAAQRPAGRQRPQSANINGNTERVEYDKNYTLHRAHNSKMAALSQGKKHVTEDFQANQSQKVRPRTARPPNEACKLHNTTKAYTSSVRPAHILRNGVSASRLQSSASRNGQQKAIHATKVDKRLSPGTCLLFDFHDTESLIPSRPKAVLSSVPCESVGVSPKAGVRHLQVLQDCRSLNKQWSDEALDLIKNLDEDKADIPSLPLVQNELKASGFEHEEPDGDAKDYLPEQRSTHLDYLRKMREIAQSIRNDLTGDFASTQEDSPAKQVGLRSKLLDLQMVLTSDEVDGKAPTQTAPLELGQRPPLNPRRRNEASKAEELRQMKDKSAAMLIQNRIERFMSGRKAEKSKLDAISKNHAATNIQKMYRGRLAREFVAEKRAYRYEQSAIKLQAFYRGFQTRTHVNRELAASLSRSYIEEKHYQLELASAIDCREESATITIQSYVRGHQARRLTEAMMVERNVAASRIQSAFHRLRDLQAKIANGISSMAASVIQSGFHQWKQRRDTTTHLQQEVDEVNTIAAITIQQLWRSFAENLSQEPKDT
uniref:Uncharacterized protein AlNc14C6G892 n=1 Tax=Albugo laibachii Nc14 TaxID=890382 RepID=F0W1C3_9STRA|nr:conserved hypothetical protein [Albugo laibachii Nc14]|eukprot:CCA14851.1 conserved hypothetical protein [Albugo laibachii Nc14]